MKLNKKIGTNRRFQVALLFLGVTLAATAFAQRTIVSSGLLLTNVTIVDTQTGKLMPNMSVAMDGGNITKIGAASMLAAKGNAHSVDLKGKFLIPGYWEMHAHPIDSPDRANNLMLMLANGITGVRQMSGSDALLAVR